MMNRKFYTLEKEFEKPFAHAEASLNILKW